MPKNNFFTFRSIRTELSCWFLLLTLIPLIIVSSIGYWQARESLVESATEQLKQNSENTIKFINNWFDYRWMDLNRLADTELNVQFLEALNHKRIETNMPLTDFIHSYAWAEITHSFQSDLVKLSRRYDYIYDIFLIDLAGNIIYSVVKESDLGTNLFTPPYSNTLFSSAVKRSLATGEAVFSDFEHYEPSANLEAGFIAAPLIDDRGEKIGLVSIQIRLDRIQSAFNTLTKHETLHYLTAKDGILRTVIDNKNEVLTRKIGIDLPNIISEPHDISDNNRKVETYTGARGEKVLGISHRIKVWNIEWILVSEINRNKALSSANWLGWFVLFGLIFTFAIVSYLAWVVSRRITLPISVLAEATAGMANGQLDKPVVLNARNEIGRLANDFNKMMDSRRIHEEDLIQEKRNAEQASLAKSEFLACMSHEIRTPMNGVLGMLSLTLNGDVTEEQKRKLLIAQNSAQSLLSLINDILDYSKIEAGKLELEILDFNLSNLLSDVAISSALKSNEKGIELLLDIGQIDHSLNVKGDPSRLRQILVNLLGNANKFTNEGEIILSANIQKSADALRLTCSVSDTGIGIPEKNISNLFSSFSQVDASTTRKYGGTGLGLAISQRLITLTGGGDIKVKSELGVGSTFEFDMILQPSSVIPEIRPTFCLLNAHILIIDDNNTNREIFSTQITNWGGQVTDVCSVDEALAVCHAENMFDAILVDMQMPDKSGVHFAEAIKKDPALAKMKLLLMSSIDEPESLSRLKELGFSASLTKPVVPSELFESLYFVLNQDDSLNATRQLITPAYLRTLKNKESDDLDHPPIWASTVRILLVEDNRVNQQVVKGLLSHFNLACDFANNGLEALKSLVEAPKTSPYTLVLMDCQMPEMDGYEATRNIRAGKAGEKNTNIPIVAMTANAMQGDKEKCLNAGMDDYLTKPLDPEVVLKALLQWLDHSPGKQANDNIINAPTIAKPIIKTDLTNTDKNVNEKENESEFKIPQNLVTFDLHNSPPRIIKNPKLFLKILAMYLNDNQNYCGNLLQMTQESNITAVRELVHLIKGSSGNLGIIKIFEFSKQFEMNLKDNNKISVEHTDELIELVQQSFKDVECIINENKQFI